MNDCITFIDEGGVKRIAVINAVDATAYRVQILEKRQREVPNNDLPPLLFLTGILKTFPLFTLDGSFVDVLVLNEKVWASHQIKFLKGAADIYCFTGDATTSQTTDPVCESRNVERFHEWCCCGVESTAHAY